MDKLLTATHRLALSSVLRMEKKGWCSRKLSWAQTPTSSVCKSNFIFADQLHKQQKTNPPATFTDLCHQTLSISTGRSEVMIHCSPVPLRSHCKTTIAHMDESSSTLAATLLNLLDKMPLNRSDHWPKYRETDVLLQSLDLSVEIKTFRNTYDLYK